MIDSEPEEKPVVGYAWYRREQWALLRAAAADPDDLEETYDDWLPFAEESFRQRKAEGMDIRKVGIDVEELIRWCEDRNVPLDGAARAEFTTIKLREQYQG